MNRICALMAAFACVGMAADLQSVKKPASRQLSFTAMPLSFEPNLGQSDPSARFVAKSAGYTLRLEPTGARFQFGGRDKAPATLRMDLENANRQAVIAGESPLPGKANYIPTSDPKTWFTNIPTYARVRYAGVYPGIDLAFYGNASRLEYDFLLQAGADPTAIGMKLSGADQARIDASGDLLLRLGKGGDIRFLRPVAYQTSTDGRRREPVQAGYRLERSASGEPMLVSFSIGSYDRARPLVIDPVAAVPSLVYSQYVSAYAGAVAVDSSGNTYVTGTAIGANGFYVTEFSSTGTVVYSTTVGTGDIYPYAISVDSTTGQVYVAGGIYSGSTLPTSANAYQSTVTASDNAFLAVIAKGGATVPYATYLGGTDSSTSSAQGLAVDSSGNAYLTGYTYSATFPTTANAYQTALSPSYDGFVSKINPAASTGAASLVYSTLLGPGNTSLVGIAVDSADDAYVTGIAPATFPVTSGAFQYAGYDSANGGVYVTKLNSTGTALVYSAYLGYGTGYGIAVEGQANPSAYVTGIVSYADFPTTAGAYQTDYAGGFVTKLSSTGSTEVYSTFLGGPSSYVGGTSVFPSSIALPNDCSSSCNAYVAGWTNTADFPLIDAIQTTPSTAYGSGFVTEIAASGASALFSSYLSGVNSGVYNPNSGGDYGFTPSIAVDSSGNMSVVGNIYSTSDFPITISNANPTYAFLAKIGETSTAFTLASTTTVNFGSQPVGVSTSISNGTKTVRLSNFSATAATVSVTVSPTSIFSESDNCGGSIPGGGSCTLNLNFTPTVAGARSGTVTVTSNASNSPTTITVNGTGVDQPYISASPTSLVFGDQATGTSSAAQAVTLTNISDETAALNVYTNTVNFKELNNCPTQLAPGASCTASVTFSPTQPGLLTDNLYFYSPSYGTGSIPLSGSATVTGATTGLSLSTASVAFGNQVVNTTSPIQQIFVTNNGTVPVAIQSIATTVNTGSGNFAITYNACGNPTGQLNPQVTCQMQVTFTPTAAGTVTGSLTITDSTASSPHTVALNGTGVTSTETLEFYPATALAFPDTPVGVPSAQQLVYAQNAGTSPITMDRVLVSGDFKITSTSCPTASIPGTLNDGSGSYSYCYAYVTFTPTTTGARTGTLTFIDSASNSPQVVNLSGNGIAITGSLALSPTALDYPTEAVGTTSAAQLVELFNPGDTPITVTGWSATGNFAPAVYNCTPPFTYAAGQSDCYVQVTFTPTTTGSLTGTLTVNSSAGTQTVSLSGTGVAASQTIEFTPTSINFGNVIVGQTTGAYYIYVQNTGTDPVTLTSIGPLGGTNPSDFSMSTYTCPVGGQLQPGTSCAVYVQFTPATAGSWTAALPFVDSAVGSPQSVTLSGTGVASLTTDTAVPNELSYNTQVQGTTSPTNNYTYFYNNTGSSVVLGTVALTAGFVVPSGYDNCSGKTIAAGSSCYVYVSFAPTAAGYTTGTLTFKNSGGTTLISVPLAGYSPAAVNSAYLDPTALDFTFNSSGQAAVVGTTSSNQTVTLYNSGNLPLTIGTLNGTNVGAPSGKEFAIASDGCSGQTVQAGNTCTVYMNFTPSAVGAQSGSLIFPVTYASGSTANLTATLAGTGVAEKDSAVLTPSSASFVDQTVGIQTTYNVALSLTNSGNVAMTVGVLTGTNTIVGASGTGEFSTSPANSGSDGCSSQTVQPGSTCNVYVTFTPSAAGAQTGSITFPVTFKDGTTASPTATLSGKGVAANTGVQITPLSIQFPVQMESTTSAAQAVIIKNTGNAPIHIGTDTVSSNFAISYDSCVSGNLAYNSSCQINVKFTPSTTGALTGTLTVADNGTGGPHSVALSGTGIPATQQIALSQTTVAFGNQPAGSTSSTMLVYVTNQSDASVPFSAITLGGTNPTDFSMTTSCPVGSSLGARAICTISVAFAPLTGVSGALSATVTVTDSDSGSPRTITLTGTAVAPGPAVALVPASGLTFTKQNVGTTSPAQTFSVTNTGTTNLTITNVASTNAAEFAIAADGCSGATLTPKQQCTVSVNFSPSLGGARSSTITVTDNATGSPQSLAVTGTGYGIPSTSFTPTSLTFGSTNIGVTSATQTITLKNPGTDTLLITSVAITGVHAGDYAQTNTCPASLAPAATCVITVSFKPTAAGTRGASITVTDNANNAPGTTQNVALTGTGVAVPTAGVAPTTLTFSSTDIGVTSAAQTATLTNSGSGPLTITSIAIGGTNAADYSETNSCGSTLVAGSNCTISVTFKPAAAGTRTASITITDNANNTSGATQTVALTGTGAGLSGAGLSPSSLTFTDQNVSTTSAAQSLTLTNSGTGALTIASIAIGGTNAGDFAQTNTCGTSVAAGANCAISITFKPTGIGSRGATLIVTDNAGNVTGSTQTASLSGTGVGVPAAAPSPTTLTFSSQNVGTTSSAKTVTLTNSGTGALTISSIAISGTNAGDFATTNNCAGSVAASGGSCTISVTFAPAAAGARSATLTINDNAGNTASSQTVTLSGTGAGVPSAAASPTTLSFGNQNVGSTSASQTVTLSNSGSTALTITSIAIGGTNAGDFSTTNNCGSSVALGSSCSIAVTFSPAATGSRAATLTVTDNAGGTGGSTQTVSLSGTGVGVAAAAVAPSTVVFGNQNVGVTSAAQTVTLSNSGSAALTIASVAISGTNASDFATTNNCAGSVAAGSSCSISVTFDPGAPGNRSGVLTVTDNASNTAGSKQTVSLTGTGIGVPVAGVAPTSLSFAATTVGSTTAAQSVTLSNSGTGPLTISSIVIGGSNPGDFAQTNTCGTSVAAGGSCTISVTFTPAAAGSFAASLHVVDNSNNVGATQTVALTGSGVAASGPSASLSPSSLTFASQGEGTTSAAQSVTLSNSGTAALTVAGIGLTGTDPGDFAQTNTCGSSVAAGGNCTISVTFTPNAVGALSATLTVTDNSGNVSGSTQSVSLSGTGATSSGTAFIITSQPTSPLRNNFSGFVGMEFTVGSNALMVTELGRWVVSGNSGTHVVKLVNASTGVDVSGGSVSLSLSGATAGQYAYANLSSAITLAANTSYYIVSREVSGGDQWHDTGAVTASAGAGTVNGNVYQSTGAYTIFKTGSYSYGPVNFLFQ